MAIEIAKSVVTDEATKKRVEQVDATAVLATQTAISAKEKVDLLITDITEIKFVTALPKDAADHPKTLYLVKK